MFRSRGLRLKQIQIALNTAQDFIANLVFVPEMEKRGALQGANVPGQLPESRVILRPVAALRGHFAVQQVQLVMLHSDEFVIDRGKFGGILITGMLKVRKGCFNHRGACLLFFRILAGRDGNSQSANERRQRESL